MSYEEAVNTGLTPLAFTDDTPLANVAPQCLAKASPVVEMHGGVEVRVHDGYWPGRKWGVPRSRHDEPTQLDCAAMLAGGAR